MCACVCIRMAMEDEEGDAREVLSGGSKHHHYGLFRIV